MTIESITVLSGKKPGVYPVAVLIVFNASSDALSIHPIASAIQSAISPIPVLAIEIG